MNRMIDFGVYALASCMDFIIIHEHIRKICKVHFGCSNLMLHGKSQLLGGCSKGKYCKTVRMGL